MLWVVSLFKALLRLAALATFLSLFASYFWLSELLSHFPYQYFIGGLICGIFVFFATGVSRYLHLCLAAFVLIYNGYAIWNAYENSAPYDFNKPTSIDIAHLNVLHATSHTADVAEIVTDKMLVNPPLIANFQEVSPVAQGQLQKMRTKLPYNYAVPRLDSKGSSYFSVMAPENMQQIYSHGATAYTLRATYKNLVAGKVVDVFSLHTYAPVVPKAASIRNEQLERLAELVNESQADYKIVIGDLNITPYSPYFKQFLKRTSMHHTVPNVFSSATWFLKKPLSMFGLPIDHVLVSEGLGVVSRKTIPIKWTDHFLVRTRLYVE